GGPGGPGGKGPGGGGGTITAINGSTLTLRTENGTETVDTSASTTYSKEMQTVSFSTLAVGDVVHVGAAPPSTTASGTSTPPVPGTGTVNATIVTVVEPSLGGRVSATGNDGYTLVGRDGRQFTVTTTGSTRYYNGTTQASPSAVAVGDHVMAEGNQDTLTHLTADVISVGPAPGTPRAGAPAPPSSTNGSSGTSPVPSTPAPATPAPATQAPSTGS
nr:DUF5666 domain-containing protein [Actinomycetota bacterium]